MRKAILLVACISLGACGCGDNEEGDDDVDAGIPDAGPPDAEPCPARGDGEVGGGCDENTDCDQAEGAGFCYTGTDGPTTYPPGGFCTLDDLIGTVCDLDADCGAGNVCVDWVDFTPYKTCFPACGECGGDSCPSGLACFDSFNGFGFDKVACVPGDAGAEDGSTCAGFFNCADFSSCFVDIEFPGGQCSRYSCTVGDDATCNGGTCVDVSDETPLVGTTCLDTCTDDDDCRGPEGYVCFDPGNGGSSYCRHPHVGDACADADECGGSTWVCETATGFADGYCTQEGCTTAGSSDGCSSGSVCADPLVGANYCVDRCDPADLGTQGRCRTGYLCLDSDPGAAVVTGCAPPASL